MNAARAALPAGIPPAASAHDRARGWLRAATGALAALAAAAAAVSWDAQYVLVRDVKHAPAIAALEAGIRPRALNVTCIAISLAMNALASAPGWRDLAIWIMPSAVYALASDTLIGVIRAWAIARMQHGGRALADDEPTPIALIGGFLLWLLRLALAPPSTITGFRRWAVEECPIAPGRKAPRQPKAARKPALPPASHGPGSKRGYKPTKQARMLALAAQRHDLTRLPLKQVSGIANAIGAEIDLSPGTARRVLLAHVRGLQNGHPHPEQPSAQEASK
jgi:hypothetical protein